LGYCLSEKELSNREPNSYRKNSKVKEYFDTKIWWQIFRHSSLRNLRMERKYHHILWSLVMLNVSNT